MKRSWVTTTAIILGFMIMGLAIFADQLGFDHNHHWGMGRITFLALGILIVICAVLFSLVTSNLYRVYILVGLTVLLVLTVYLWFVSVGYWVNWPVSTNYFDMLATSFQHGRLSLEIKVDPVLIAMPDPYNIYAREALPHVTYLFDGSFYKGAFYLYWGPVPALLMVPFKYLFQGPIGDQVLVFVFVSGLFIFQSLLILKIWSRFFEELPAWVVLMGILLVGLVSPTTWILNQPQVYEASIVSGQFFLIGGVYFAFMALDGPKPSVMQMGIAGILWSCSIGSRNVLALPVIFMVLLTALWVIRYRAQASIRINSLFLLSGLILPLAVGAGLLGWYNWARFGSVFETGLRFQLSGINYRDYYNDLFSIQYFLLNLRYYLLAPFKSIHDFPFIKPIPTYSWPSLTIPTPVFYYAKERVTGLLYTSPFLLFAVIAAIFSFSRVKPVGTDQAPVMDYGANNSLRFLLISLMGITAISSLTLLLYYYCTMRFVEDFIPALALLAVFGFWQGYRFYLQGRFVRLFYGFISMGFAGYTVAAGTLLGISSYTERFRYINPALFNTMIKFFVR